MAERFFFKYGETKLDGGRRSNEKDLDLDPITLLSGPPSCGKTSLLFQYALNLAAEAEAQGYVVFMCNHRRLEAKPPFLLQSQSQSQGFHLSSPLFRRIHLKYVDDEECIKKYFAAFHLLYPWPLAVIIDDFGDFFYPRKCQERYSNARGRDLAMVRVLALCQSAILHACTTAPCKLLLSDTHHGETPRLLFLYRRWISSMFTIEAQGERNNRPSSFLLSTSTSTSTEGKTTAKYSVAPQYLIFEGIAHES